MIKLCRHNVCTLFNQACLIYIYIYCFSRLNQNLWILPVSKAKYISMYDHSYLKWRMFHNDENVIFIENLQTLYLICVNVCYYVSEIVWVKENQVLRCHSERAKKPHAIHGQLFAVAHLDVKLSIQRNLFLYLLIKNVQLFKNVAVKLVEYERWGSNSIVLIL